MMKNAVVLMLSALALVPVAAFAWSAPKPVPALDAPAKPTHVILHAEPEVQGWTAYKAIPFQARPTTRTSSKTSPVTEDLPKRPRAGAEKILLAARH